MKFWKWRVWQWGGWRWIERGLHTIAFVLAVGIIAWIVAFVGRPAEKSGSQPNFAGAEQQKKRLAIYLDGTWNSVDSNTNVWRMRALTASKSTDDRPQLVYYSIGVNGFMGGIFGKGLDDNIRLAYEWLIENYTEGDEIFIFGFSRGAFTARSLAGLVALEGILKAGAPIGIAELFGRYQKGGNEESIWTLKDKEAAGQAGKLTDQERWLLKYSQPTKVKFVGVWDTVGSVGLAAGDIPGISRSRFTYLQTGLFLPILNGYHALAIDEHRRDFAPTLWTVRHHKDAREDPPPRALSNVEQRWFVGAHANVGGGYETDLLAQAPLRWMMQKAEAHGLSFRSEVVFDGDALKAPVIDSYHSFVEGTYSIVSSPLNRVIGAEPDAQENGTHTTVNETIDASVFQRWQADPTYRPASLVEWAKRKKADPAQLKTAIRADDPRVTVPEQ